MAWVRRLLPAVLLLAAAGGLGYVGIRAVQSERAMAERTARQQLAARAREAATTLDAAAQELLRQTRAGKDTVAMSADGSPRVPPAPTGMPPLQPIAEWDPEGAFFLEAAERAEGRAADAAEARSLYSTARSEQRDRIVRALATLRLAALSRGNDGPSEVSDGLLREGVALLEKDERRTRDALLARTLLRDPADTALVPDLLCCLGGPDEAVARGLLGELRVSKELIVERESELARVTRLRSYLPRIGATLSGAALLDDLLVAWRRDPGRDGAVEIADAHVPELPGMTAIARAPVPEDLLFEESPVEALSGVRVVATTPWSDVARDARQRAVLLIGALALLAAGGLLALWLTLRAARRHAAAARAQAAFVARVGHDLRTPIANIRLYAETLAAGRASATESAEFASVAAREAARVSSMVEKVLEVARLDEGPRDQRPTPVEVGALVDEVVAAHRPLLVDAGVTLDVSVDGRPLTVIGWADALKGALGNLVENVLAHAASGGSLEIGAQRVGDRVEVRVADRGPGLPKGLGARVFERFVRGPEARSRGCGLGLALVKDVARAHRGDAAARDRDHGGAEFLLVLPGAAT